LDRTDNKWNIPLLYSEVIINDTAKSTDLPYELIQASSIVPFTIPFNLLGSTEKIPSKLGSEYATALEEKSDAFAMLKELVEKKQLNQSKKVKLQASIEQKFKEWLVESGNITQIEDLIQLQLHVPR